MNDQNYKRIKELNTIAKKDVEDVYVELETFIDNLVSARLKHDYDNAQKIMYGAEGLIVRASECLLAVRDMMRSSYIIPKYMNSPKQTSSDGLKREADFVEIRVRPEEYVGYSENVYIAREPDDYESSVDEDKVLVRFRSDADEDEIRSRLVNVLMDSPISMSVGDTDIFEVNEEKITYDNNKEFI